MLRVNLIVFLVSANKTNIDNICVAFPELPQSLFRNNAHGLAQAKQDPGQCCYNMIPQWDQEAAPLIVLQWHCKYTQGICFTTDPLVIGFARNHRLEAQERCGDKASSPGG
jgi:hypothetical protein